MVITEVNVSLAEADGPSKIKGYASMVVDGALAVHNLRLVEISGRLEVCMPDRMICDHCPECRAKVFILAHFCERCGHRLADPRERRVGGGKAFACVVHPINREARKQVEDVVLAEYRRLLGGELFEGAES